MTETAPNELLQDQQVQDLFGNVPQQQDPILQLDRTLIQVSDSSETEEDESEDQQLHDVIKAVKSSLAQRGSSLHRLQSVEYEKIFYSEQGEIEYKQVAYRWLILFLACGLILNISLAQVGFAAFISQIEVAYVVSKWPVVVLIVTPGILYAPVTYMTSMLLAHWKTHSLIKLAALIQLLGCWSRVLSFIWAEQFWLLSLSSGIFFISNPLILNSIGSVKNLWFSEDERARAATIAGLMVPLGCLLGLVMTSSLTAGADMNNQGQCMQSFKLVVFSQNALFSFICILVLVFFNEKPDTPPSKLALVVRRLSPQGIREDIATLSNNRNFILTLTVFALIWGNYVTFRNVLGLFFAGQFSLAQISIPLINIPLLPATLSYASKITMHIPPMVVSGLMMSAAQTWAVFMSLIMTYLLSCGHEYGLAFMACTIIVALTCASQLKSATDDKKQNLKPQIVEDSDEDTVVQDDDTRIINELECFYSLFYA